MERWKKAGMPVFAVWAALALHGCAPMAAGPVAPAASAPAAPAAPTPAPELAAFEAERHHDYALPGPLPSPDLTVYALGEHLVPMAIIGAFQRANPQVRVIALRVLPSAAALVTELPTRPPGPAVVASADLAGLQAVHRQAPMHAYLIYARNRLALAVADGNPRAIAGPVDLRRTDLVQLAAGLPALADSAHRDTLCPRCPRPIPGREAASLPLREVLDRIENGTADVGIGWAPDIHRAREQGRRVQAIALDPPLDLADRAGYVIGALGPVEPEAAHRFINYLASEAGQEAYVRQGYLRATGEDLRRRPIPLAD